MTLLKLMRKSKSNEANHKFYIFYITVKFNIETLRIHVCLGISEKDKK